MNKCKRCGKNKDESLFGKNKSTKSGLHYWCKECTNKTEKEWKKENRQKVREQKKRYRKKYPEKSTNNYRKNRPKHYGTTQERIDKLLKNQNNRCAICHVSFETKTACVDHDHGSGLVRGMLCKKCNTGIGMLGDNPETCKAAAVYLEGFYGLVAEWKCCGLQPRNRWFDSRQGLQI